MNDIIEQNFVKSKYIVVYWETIMVADYGWKISTEENQAQETKLKLVRKLWLFIEESINTQTIRDICQGRFEDIQHYFEKNIYIIKEAVARSCSVKKVFLAISQNSQKNNCARASLNKVAALT